MPNCLSDPLPNAHRINVRREVGELVPDQGALQNELAGCVGPCKDDPLRQDRNSAGNTEVALGPEPQTTTRLAQRELRGRGVRAPEFRFGFAWKTG